MTGGARMEEEIAEQPGILHANHARYRSNLLQFLRGKSFDMVLLAARGSSDNAALFARYLIETHLKIPVCLAAPSVITQFQADVRYPNCLAVGISQSGAAPDVSEVISHLRRQGHCTVAITNTPESALSDAAEFTLLLEAGDERSIAATKTYSASVLALAQLVSAMTNSIGNPQLPDEEWLATCREAATQSSGHVVRCSPIFSLGRGYLYGTAVETALKLMECALIPAKSYSTADFHHGPKALAGSNSAMIVFGEIPGELSAMASTLLRPPPSSKGIWTPLWQIIYGQWLALLASRARGLDPDDAPNLAKITRTY